MKWYWYLIIGLVLASLITGIVIYNKKQKEKNELEKDKDDVKKALLNGLANQLSEPKVGKYVADKEVAEMTKS